MNGPPTPRQLTLSAPRPTGLSAEEVVARATGGGVDPVRRLPVEPGALTEEMVAAAAQSAGVCGRPILARVHDLEIGGPPRTVAMACGSTREDRCPPCAERAKRLRIQQCREGWHLETEPDDDLPHDADLGEVDQGGDDRCDEVDRRIRSTRRRQDAPELPRLPMEEQTVGRVFVAPDGKTYRPSMFVTLTMPSYGRVTSEGVSMDTEAYDYRRAALDALHFPKLIDRFWQN